MKQFCKPKPISKKALKVLYLRYTAIFLIFAFISGGAAVFNIFVSIGLFIISSAMYIFFISFYRKAYYKAIKYCLYSNKIYLKKGVFFLKESTISIKKIQSIEILISPIQKWLGLCTIVFRFAGGQVTIPNIDLDSANIIKCEIKGGECNEL